MFHKKFILVALTIVLGYFTVFAQERSNTKNDFQINAGIGLRHYEKPIYLGVDYFVHKNISLGAELDYSHSKGDAYLQTNYRANSLGGKLAINYHFNSLLKMSKRWDLYAGLHVSSVAWNFKSEEGNWSGIAKPAVGIQIGTRYYISKRVALNLEITGGSYWQNKVKLGATYKF